MSLEIKKVDNDNKIKNFTSENQGRYSQHFIFFGTFKWAHSARALHYNRQEVLARDKHSSVLGPFKRYEENEVL